MAATRYTHTHAHIDTFTKSNSPTHIHEDFFCVCRCRVSLARGGILKRRRRQRRTVCVCGGHKTRREDAQDWRNTVCDTYCRIVGCPLTLSASPTVIWRPLPWRMSPNWSAFYWPPQGKASTAILLWRLVSILTSTCVWERERFSFFFSFLSLSFSFFSFMFPASSIRSKSGATSASSDGVGIWFFETTARGL